MRGVTYFWGLLTTGVGWSVLYFKVLRMSDK